MNIYLYFFKFIFVCPSVNVCKEAVLAEAFKQ